MRLDGKNCEEDYWRYPGINAKFEGCSTAAATSSSIPNPLGLTDFPNERPPRETGNEFCLGGVSFFLTSHEL